MDSHRRWLRGAHGFAGRFGGAWRQLDRVIGHLVENVELPLELADPAGALVFLELRRRGWDDARIEKVVWDNPRDFYAQSGRLQPPTAAAVPETAEAVD